MNVLFAVWELDPLIKVGGLGDVARSLPAALRDLGVDVRVILPFYKAIRLGRIKKTKVGEFKMNYGGINEKVEIIQVANPITNIPVYLLRNDKYLGIAHHPDTFAFFDKAIIKIISENVSSWTPEIVHCNDLHTGLIPLLVKENKIPVKTILTIHNLSYQGKASIEVLDKLKMDKTKCHLEKWEVENRQLNFLMEGIIHADVVTTVSPTYAKEIMTEEFGCGLEEVLRGKAGKVFGILNGIDNSWKSSSHTKYVKFPYMSLKNKTSENTESKIYDWEEGKMKNKLYLQKKLGLKIGRSIPMLSFIGRIDPNQKGIDILHKMVRKANLSEYELVILGTGDQSWEERFQWLGQFYPDNVSCNFKFDEKLANQIYAASDFIIIPSKFEPCGLIQMIAMFYGTLPIAHKTGGLIDSIKDNENGFIFEHYSSEALENAVQKALFIWHQDKSRYKKMVETAMQSDFSWRVSAKQYQSLYNELINNEL
ncbi:glycogen synthase [Candidatus Gottesmanbacteria bacterium]|nr:glycogen synthase [Candidatus Gottesmanbacteria bacterium]